MLFALGVLVAVIPPPTLPTGPTAADAQWAAVEASPRVGGGPNGGRSGTAVCVGCRDGFAYVLTAAHLLPAGEPRAYEFFARGSYPKVARTLTRGEVVMRLADADVALVRLPAGDKPVPAVRLAAPGERPKRFPAVAVAVGCPDAAPPACRLEKLVEKSFVRRPGGGEAFFWQAASAPVGGMSGGPLLDAGGRVIGVCAAAQGRRGFFAHLDEIQYGLKQGGYEWLYAPGPAK